MCFKFKRFKIIDWNGKKHYFTAKQLYEHILKDAKSKHNLITSVSDILELCDRIDFPQNYARKIKLLILEHSAMLEIRREIWPLQKSGDKEAVYSCYNSLTGTEPEVLETKSNYVCAIIEGVAKYHFSLIDFNHRGPTYQKICDNWKTEQVEKYSSQPQLDFHVLRSCLNESFDTVMRKAESEGTFKVEDDQRFENMRHFLSTLKLDEK